MGRYNVKQITQRDVFRYEDNNYINIKIDGEKPISVMTKYGTFSVPDTDQAIKFGFCMNSNSGIGFPIFLYTEGGGEGIQIVIGKTGMYEWQPEEWQNVNNKKQSGVIHTANYPIKFFQLPLYVVETDSEGHIIIDPDTGQPIKNPNYIFDYVLDYMTGPV